MDGIRATPMQYPILGLLADKLKKAQQFAVAPGGYANPPVEILLNLLGVPAVQQTMERVAYGEPLTTGKGMTTQVRPEVMEAAMTLLPVAGKTAQVAERGAMAAGRAGERLAERVVPQIMERGGMPAGLLEGMSQGAKSNVITEETLPILKSMTKEQFLGKPKIVGKSDAADLRPIELRSLESVEKVPFLDKYTAKFGDSGAVVFDGEKPIASYNFGDTLTVDKKYRGKGIGEELVYQWRTSYPAEAAATTRNKMSQALQEKVWERIKKDIPEKEGLLGQSKAAFTYPQEEALRLAQQRAALPVSEGGLGLRADNTAAERADAMFPHDVYHGTNADIEAINTAGKGKTSGAGAFVIDNPLPAETYVNAQGGANIIPMRMSKEGLLSVNAKGRNWADIDTNTLAPKAGRKRYSLDEMELDKNSATSTDELGIIAKDLLGLKGVEIKNVKDLGPNSHIFRAKEYLYNKYGIVPDETWSNVTGNQFAEARDYMDKLYKSQKGTVTAVQDADLLRSRFAAFDPWRRTAAIAATMGVAAPDLLAEEQPKKKKQSLLD